MKKPNLQRLAQRSKIYLRKASPTILSGLGAAGVIVTSVLAVRATPKALRKIRADSKTNHDGDPEAYSKLEAVKYQHGSAIFRQQLAVRQRYSASSVPMC